MAKIIHFEIPADDPERAVKFFTDVFGWKIEKEGPIEYWLINAGKDNEPGINGAILRRTVPVLHVANTIQVESIDTSVKKIVASGGKALTPKNPILGVGYVAYFQDPEGNVFSLLQPDTSAG